MKADRYGTPTENLRWNAGWMTATQRREHPEMGRCRDCRSFVESDSGRHQGEHCALHSFSTRAGAVCRDFRAQEAA